MTSTSRVIVWLSFFCLMFFVAIGFLTLKAEEARSIMQVECVKAGGSVESGYCINR